jgi:ORF6N domain
MKPTLVTTDVISSKIYFFQEEKVLLDTDLAQLFAVKVKRLKEAVRRSIARFPKDLMFELTDEEWQPLRTQIASLEKGRGKYPKYPPFAFTEQSVAMLSGISNSPLAIETNIAIMRTFVELRKWMQFNKELAVKIKLLENKYDEQLKAVFDAIRQRIQQETKKMRPIGFKISKSKR